MSPNPRILVVEDSPEIQMVVTQCLQANYNITVAATAAKAVIELKRNTFSLILLDIQLPDGNGFDLCSQIRMDEKIQDTPIIILTDKNTVSDKVMGLNLGADDYITKPIEIREFQARVNARIRRRESDQQKKNQLRVGPFFANLTEHKIYVVKDGQEHYLDLTRTEFKLLIYFMQRDKQVLTREQILESVWGNTANVTDRTVDSHVYSLRKKLGEYSIHISAERAIGYRFSQSGT